MPQTGLQVGCAANTWLEARWPLPATHGDAAKPRLHSPSLCLLHSLGGDRLDMTRRFPLENHSESPTCSILFQPAPRSCSECERMVLEFALAANGKRMKSVLHLNEGF